MKALRRALGAAGLLALLAGPAHAGAYDDFFVGIIRDNPNRVRESLAQGVDPNSRYEKGQPALEFALSVDSTRAAEVLLAAPGLDVDARNASGETALMLAAIKGDLAWCERLLARGARVNQPGWNALHYAASGPVTDTVRLMLSKGAAIDARAPNGATALMMAAGYGAQDSVELLLAKGADPKLRTAAGLGPAEFAEIAGREALAARLKALR